MLLPSQIRLLAAILALLLIGWWVKQHREEAVVEPAKVKSRAKH